MALLMLAVALGCGSGRAKPAKDAAMPGAMDATPAPVDAGEETQPEVAAEVETEVAPEVAPDLPPATVHSCGAFSAPSNWTTAAGFRSAVVAEGMPLQQPVALIFAGGGFGDRDAFVVDQGAGAMFRLNAKTGVVSNFVANDKWGASTALLTTVLWDQDRAFDGNLYVADQGTDSDQDSIIFRVDPTGASSVFTMAPGAAMDDIFGLAFSPGGAYPAGLYVSGDTDGATDGFAVVGPGGAIAKFATFSGVEGMAIDKLGRFGGGLFASMPAGGGFPGDDTVSKINPDGTKATPPLAMGLAGVHALVFAPNGPFGGDAYVASWDSGKVLRIATDGTVTELATGLSLTNYDGNILAFSPDGRVLFVADRAQSRIVCIEPAAPAQ
jgi:hypothetical protein